MSDQNNFSAVSNLWTKAKQFFASKFPQTTVKERVANLLATIRKLG